MKMPPNPWKFGLAGIVILALACLTLAQPGGGTKPGGDNGGLNPGDANKIREDRFKDQAKDYLVIDKMPGWLKAGMEKYAKENGITDGKLSQQQYLQYANTFLKHHGKGNFLDKDNPKSGGAELPSVLTVAKVEGSTIGGDKTHTARLTAGVKYKIRLKTSQPGYDPYLYLYDPDGQLVAQDDDGDGFPNAKIVYTPAVDGLYQVRCTSFGGKTTGQYLLSVEGGSVILGAAKFLLGAHTPGVVNLGALDERPVVYSGTKLPPAIPSWFAELDTDKDGQLGLYEWLAAKKSHEEFQAMDRNGDGFLTPAELLYYLYGETDPDAVAIIPENSSDKFGKSKFGGFKDFPTKPAN